MAEPSCHLELGTGSDDSLPKRRKLRKGTQSCWECKRRKTRCIFAAPSEPTCVGCKSRRTKCVSQEFDDDISVARGQTERLDRVELQVAQLVNQAGNHLSQVPVPRLHGLSDRARVSV